MVMILTNENVHNHFPACYHYMSPPVLCNNVPISLNQQASSHFHYISFSLSLSLPYYEVSQSSTESWGILDTVGTGVAGVLHLHTWRDQT